MIVVIGATGSVGKEAVRLLRESGNDVTAVTRKPSDADFAEGVRVVGGRRAAARASGLAWTFLRSADFSANALAWAPQIRATDAVRAAYPDAATSPIHHRDIAEKAVAAPTTGKHEGQAYVLTGPASLTQRDKIALIGEAVGRPLTLLEADPDEVRAQMIAKGLPEEISGRLLGSLADYACRPGPTTDTVKQLLGRPALDFATWAAENARAFRR